MTTRNEPAVPIIGGYHPESFEPLPGLPAGASGAAPGTGIETVGAIDAAALDRIVSSLAGTIPAAARSESLAAGGGTDLARNPTVSIPGTPSPTLASSEFAAASIPGAPIIGTPITGAPDLEAQLIGTPALDAALHRSPLPAPSAAAAALTQTALNAAARPVGLGSESIVAPGTGGAIDAAALDRITSSLLAAVSGLPLPNEASSAVFETPAAIPVPGAYAPAAILPAFPEATFANSSRAGALPAPAPFALNIEGLEGALPRLFDGDSRLSSAPPAGVTPAGYYFLTPALAPAAPAPLHSEAYFRRRIFDVDDIRRDFPILEERIHGKRLIWLDNAATTQKPRAVIDRLVYYYEHEYSNVHRGAHTLAARSTEAYENAREKVQHFIGAGSPEEIVFVRGTTEAINLVAASYGSKFVDAGDEIVLSTLEHHSNIVPWQFLAQRVGATIRVVPVTDRGEVLLGDFERTLSTRTRLVAVTHVSNALGTILPVRDMIQAAHRRGARVLIDGAQAVSHFPVNVQELDADFYVFSGHKMFGPSAIGVLYGKKALLDELPPWQGGGNMIQKVTFDNSTFADPPARFEAGTAALGPAVGLGAAVDYLERIGMANVARHERELLAYTHEALGQIPGLTLIGTAPEKAGVASFITDRVTPEEMGKLLDQEGIAVRAGHHCAQPTMDRFGLEATVRPSLALYNTHDEIDQLARAIRRALKR